MIQSYVRIHFIIEQNEMYLYILLYYYLIQMHIVRKSSTSRDPIE